MSQALRAALVARGFSSVVVSEEECGGGGLYGGDRAQAFASAASEKVSRARFKSSVERGLNDSGCIVIADGCNASKGFRYELSVLARNARTDSLCLWVGPDVTLAVAQGVNSARGEGGVAAAVSVGAMGGASPAAVPTPYQAPCLHDLWQRFEAPDARNKWDSPLLRVPLLNLHSESQKRLEEAAASAVHLPCKSAARGFALGSAWWAPAGQAEQQGHCAASGGAPLLTSRFALTQLQASSEFALDRGSGAVVEVLGAEERRTTRLLADAVAGYGAVPLRGFTALGTRASRGATPGAPALSSSAAALQSPDYFAEDFNCDRRSEDEDEEQRGAVGGDIANLGDFEGFEDSSSAAAAAAFSAPSAIESSAALLCAGGGSFRRAGGGKLGRVEPGLPQPQHQSSQQPQPQQQQQQHQLFSAPRSVPAVSTTKTDALQVAQEWMMKYFTAAASGGRAGGGSSSVIVLSEEGGCGEESGESAHRDLCEQGSGLVVGAVEEALKLGALSLGSFLALPHTRTLLRLLRVPTLAEMQRHRREWVAAMLQRRSAATLSSAGPAPAGEGDGCGAALSPVSVAVADLSTAVRLFAQHVNSALRSSA